jgi:DNA-binding SARP family transcriptional activator/tetratricopeptide (TPR) repeat protein
VGADEAEAGGGGGGVEFRILGPLEVIHDGRAVPVGGSRERAVLALLLASANRVVSAERLADDLWCGRPPERAAHSLQVFVSRLRKALREAGGDGIVVTRPPGYVAEIPPERLDAGRFETLVAAGRLQAGKGTPEQASATLREALALWRGPALAEVADAPVARAEAARLEDARLAATEERIDADLACGRHGELTAELDVLTRQHPLRERLWGQRMVALYRSGRQVEALRAFQDLRRFLADQVGLEPSPALASLETAILRQASYIDWQPPVPEPLSLGDGVKAASPVFAARTPYVGREAERAELARLLDGAVAGRGALALVGGEPGVGKTRLTEEVGADATARGFRVLVGRCYEIEGAPPYVPFVEILEEALAAAPSPEDFRALLGEEAPEVARLLPRLRRLFPDIPPPLELPPEQERHYLFNSLRDVVARAAAARPLFLVLEDLHWADDGTLLLVEHLAERLPRLAVLAVGTYRDTEVTPEHRLARPLESLLRERRAQRMGLQRFAVDGVAALLRALSGQDPPPSLVEAVHAETQGNPFFTEEVFKHLAEEGRLFDEDGRFRPEPVIGELDVPESLRLVLGRRLERLGGNGRRALSAAAVVGRAFTYELLEALGEVPPDVLLDVLDEAEGARLVAPLSDDPGEDRLLFSHELIRQTLLSGLSQPRRRRLHLRVADTLEQLYADRLDEQASEIAHHLTRAGSVAERGRLLRYLTLAGRQAMRTAGYEDALRHFEQAVSMSEAAEPAERPELFAGRAAALRSLGRLEDGLPDWDAALRHYEAVGDLEAAARMCLESSRDLWWLNRDAEAFERAEHGLTVLGDRETAQRVEMLGWTGVAGAWVSPFEPGAKMTDEALVLAERLGDRRLVAYGLVTRALHRFAFGLHRDVLEAGREGTRLLREEGDLWEACTLLAFMEGAALELGRIPLATELAEEVETLASRLGHAFALDVLHEASVVARGLVVAPDLAAFEASARRQLELVGPMGFSHICGGFLAHGLFLRGDWEEALRVAGEAVRHAPEHHHTSGSEWGCYLRVLAYLGRPAEVAAVLDGRRADLPQLGRPNGYGPSYLPGAAIEALSVIGDRDGAAGFYPFVREYIATTGVVLHWWSPYLHEKSAGIGAAAGGRWDAAEEHFRTALRQAEELPFAIEGAETRRWYARMLLDRNAAGDRDRARSLVEEAIAVYRGIGMPRHETLALALVTA